MTGRQGSREGAGGSRAPARGAGPLSLTILHVEPIAAGQPAAGPSDAGPSAAALPSGADPHRDAPLPLVLLHGFTGDATTWRRLAPHLGDDRPVLAFDLVGHGSSPDPRDPEAYTMDAAVASVAEALRRQGYRRAHWLGYSMGGRVALALAVERTEMCAGLVLVGANPGLADPIDRAARVAADEADASAIEGDGVAPFVERWMRNPLFASQENLGADYLAEARAQRLKNRPAALAASLRGMGTGAMPPLWSRLGDLDRQTLLVTGALDTKFGAIANRMAALMPRARWLSLPGVGHAAHAEAPRELGEAVREFLRSVDRDGPSDRPTDRPSRAGIQS